MIAQLDPATFEFRVRSAEAERGVALLPQHMASASERAGRLQRVLAQEPTPVWPVYAVTVGRQLPERVRLLLAHVRSALRTVAMVAP